MRDVEFWNSIIYDLESFGMIGDCNFNSLVYKKQIENYTYLRVSVLKDKEGLERKDSFTFAIKISTFDYNDIISGGFVKEEDIKTIISLKERIFELMQKEHENINNDIIKFHSVSNNALLLCTRNYLYVMPKYGGCDYFCFKYDGRHFREALEIEDNC